MLPIKAHAADESDLTFRLNSEESYTITDCSSSASGALTIPSTYNGKIVNAIADSAFKDCTKLTAITIPDGITTIGKSAFENCTGLTGMTIPDSVTTIGNSAFAGCSQLTDVKLGSGITTISFFQNCTGLKSFTIPDTITTVGKYAFEGCTNLADITIPSSVTTIDAWAFSGCSKLTKMLIPDTVNAIGTGVLSGCTKLETLTIPFVGDRNTTEKTAKPFGYIFGTKYFSSGEKAHQGQLNADGNRLSYETYYIPRSLQSVIITGGGIQHGAFQNCANLISVSLPNGIIAIPANTFENCPQLQSVTIPASVTAIGNGAFGRCENLVNVYITDLAAWCKISFDSAVFFYKAGTLYLNNQPITNLQIPEGATAISSYAFTNCTKLQSVTIPDTVTTIGNYAFSKCAKLQNITLPDTVTSIGTGAFSNCENLTAVKLPEGITCISNRTFNDCTNLADITIPNTVTTIGESAFYGCFSLKYNVYDNGKYLGNQANPNFVLIKATSPSITQIKIHADTKIIYDLAFKDCTGLTSVTIPEDVTCIGVGAFTGCSGLKTITIPDNVTAIGFDALAGCSGLKSITIPFIAGGQYAYYTHLGGIFGKDSYTGSVAAEEYTPRYGEDKPVTYTYYLPEGLTSVTVTGGKITESAFSNCKNISAITLCDGITDIGANAFYGCTGLTELTIPDSVTTIGSTAFSNCDNLKTIRFTGSRSQWNAITNKSTVTAEVICLGGEDVVPTTRPSATDSTKPATQSTKATTAKPIATQPTKATQVPHSTATEAARTEPPGGGVRIGTVIALVSVALLIGLAGGGTALYFILKKKQ